MSESMERAVLPGKRPHLEAVTSSSCSSRAGSSKSFMCVDDFECAVCFELLLDPVVAPCGHDMCLHCYQQWTRSCSPAVCSAVCPLCRCPLPNNLAVCLRLKETIERLYHKDLKRRRNEQIAESNQSANFHVPCSPALPHPLPSPSPSPMQLGTTPLDLLSAWSAAQHALMSVMMLATHAMSMTQQTFDPSSNPWSPIPTSEPSTAVEPPSVAPSSCCSSESYSIAPSAGTSSASDVSNNDVGAMQPAAQRRHWQSGTDATERLAMARSILHVLQARGLHSSLGSKLPDTVRLLELMLYRSAPSKAAYLDPSDLEERIATTVRQRTRAARARRMHLGSPSEPIAPVGSAMNQ